MLANDKNTIYAESLNCSKHGDMLRLLGVKGSKVIVLAAIVQKAGWHLHLPFSSLQSPQTLSSSGSYSASSME